MPIELLICEDHPALVERAAEWIAGVLEGLVRSQGSGSIALAGGNTPRPVYQRLAGLPVPWNHLSVFFSDERSVPPGDPLSNYRMAIEMLLSFVPIPPERIHRMEAERGDREVAARDYEALLPDPLDLLLLGMGADGHTASLFPHSEALEESGRRVVPARAPEGAARLTITPAVIRSARRVLMLVEGAEKATMVARALEGPDDSRSVPAQLARHGTWMLDRAAAAELTPPAR